jgi:Mg2+ and Co2+ transporter CorA
MNLATPPVAPSTPPDQQVVNCIAYRRDGQRIGEITLDEISDVLAQPDTFVWVGLYEPDETLLEKMQEEFGLHDLAIEDARNAHQRPKIETYGNSLFIVDNLLPIVRDFREELQQLEQDIFAETFKRTTVRRLYDMQRDLMTLRLAVAPLQDIISQLVRLHPNLIPDKLRAYFRDVYDHVFRVNESIGAMREMLSAAISVNLSLVSFGQNEVMKKLAGWAAMLAAPTLLTSWYGMNFQHMPELGRPWAYPAIIVVMACIVGGIYIGLKRARWL